MSEGDIAEITVPEAAESHIGPEDIPLEVIFEDEDLIVIDKPVGMVVHPAPGTPGGTLVNALLHHFGDGRFQAWAGQSAPGSFTELTRIPVVCWLLPNRTGRITVWRRNSRPIVSSATIVR